MGSFTIDCSCGERYHVDDSQVGRQLVCRRCANRVAIRSPDEAPVAPPMSPRKARIRKKARPHKDTNRTPLAYPIVIQRTVAAKVLTLLTWGYLAAVVLVAGLTWGLGDRSVIGTVLLFMGRWVFLLPLLVLVPLVVWLRARLLVPLAVGGLVVLGPVMGFRTGWRRLLPAPAGQQVRVVSFNAGGGRIAAQLLPSVLERWQAQLV